MTDGQGVVTAFDMEKQLLNHESHEETLSDEDCGGEELFSDEDYDSEWHEDLVEDTLFPFSIYDHTPPVNRSEIPNLARIDDIKPGAIIAFCDTLGERKQAQVVIGPYVRGDKTWFDVVKDGSESPLYVSPKDEGIVPLYGDHYQPHHWTELISPAP